MLDTYMKARTGLRRRKCREIMEISPTGGGLAVRAEVDLCRGRWR